MTQPDLFKPIAHRTDPASSHGAAARVQRSGRQKSRAWRIWVVLKALNTGYTAYELFCYSTWPHVYELRRALSDAKNAGLIRQGVTRKCRTGHPRCKGCTEWWPR